jgi:membrane protease YdiL (CAAX protease family)
MNYQDRFLAGRTPLVQLLILIMLVLFSGLIVFLAGVLIAVPFFGTNVLDLLTQASGMNVAEDVNLMKYFQIISQLGIFIIPPLVFSLLVTNRPSQYLWLNRFPGRVTVLATVILIFAVLPGINWLLVLNEQLSLPEWLSGVETWMRQSEDDAARLTEAFLKTETIPGLLLNLFMVAFLASVGEELLFRGVLLRILHNWTGNAHVAVWISAILFSMFHLQFFGFLPRMALGIIFGYLLVWSGSLWLPIIAHFINNGAAVVVYFFYNIGSTDISMEDFGTVENSLFFTISILVSIGLMFIIYFQNRGKFQLFPHRYSKNPE